MAPPSLAGNRGTRLALSGGARYEMDSSIVTTSAWRNRIVRYGEEAPEGLTANPRNWRTHPTPQRAALESVLDEVGYVQNVVVNERTGHVVDGHLRIESAIAHRQPTVPVTYVDLSEDEERLILASLDPLAAMAQTDKEQLAALMASIDSGEDRIAALLASIGKQAGVPFARQGQTDPDAIPHVDDADVVVERGWVYQLGAHRLMCGDSTNADDVATLLNGAKPPLMVTDPPYGVEYDPEWRQRAGLGSGGATGKVANDDRADWTEAWLLSPSDVAYVWHAGTGASVVEASLATAGYELRSQIIWAKPHFVIGRGHYHVRHEPCWYAVRKGKSAAWIGDRKQATTWSEASEQPSPELIAALYRQLVEGSDLWEIHLDQNEGGHSTQKPVECMERPMRNHEGDVYEPFSGSGTTLIAAERQSRRAFAMELEPKYVQIALTRWESYTGLEAERVA